MPQIKDMAISQKHLELTTTALLRKNAEPEGHLVVTPQKSQWGMLHKVAVANKSDAVPTGVMVALFVPESVARHLALPNGLDKSEIHLTMAFLGKAAQLENPFDLMATVAKFAKTMPPLTGTITGVDRFTAKPGEPEPIFATVDIPELTKWRGNLVRMLNQGEDKPATDHDFHPHITLMYVPPGTPAPITELPPYVLNFDTLTLAIGGKRYQYPLEGALAETKGGPGSGDYGHAGRAGEVGGSGEAGDYEHGGKAYVVEDLMKGHGLDGGAITQPDANALALRAVQDVMGSPEWVKVNFIPAESMPLYHADPTDIGFSHGNSIGINADKDPTTLTILHETAHVLGTYRGDQDPNGHGKAWQETAAQLYGKYISPEAEKFWRDMMDTPKKSVRTVEFKRSESGIPDVKRDVTDEARDDHGRWSTGASTYVPDHNAPEKGVFDFSAVQNRGTLQQIGDPVYRQSHKTLVQDGLQRYKGWNDEFRTHADDEVHGAPLPSSGSGKIMRSRTAAVLWEIANNSRANNKPLYRGSNAPATRVEEWSESRAVANHWAQKNGGAVVMIPKGAGLGIRIEDYNIFDPEHGWLMQPPPAKSITIADIKGGPGSGDHGHEGRPGEVGGSGSREWTTGDTFERPPGGEHVRHINGNELRIPVHRADVLKVLDSIPKDNMQAAMGIIRDLPFEVGIVYRPDGTEIMRDSNGQPDSIEWSPVQIRAMRGGVMLHNHPSRDDPEGRFEDSSFSPPTGSEIADFGTAMLARLSELRLVSQNFNFTLAPPGQGFFPTPAAWVTRAIADAKQEFNASPLGVENLAGRVGYTEMQREAFHQMWIKFAEKTAFQYTRTPK